MTKEATGMKRSLYVLLFVLVFSLLPWQVLADINWAEMSNEEIEMELAAGKQELLSRKQSEFELGVPIFIENKYGSYLFTLHGAHILGEHWEKPAKEKGDDCIMISVQGVCENIDCRWLGDEYVPNYQLQLDIRVTDQDGFSLEPYDISGGDDGRYEVGAETGVGEMKRVSLIYYAYSDNTSIHIAIPGYEGSIELELQ